MASPSDLIWISLCFRVLSSSRVSRHCMRADKNNLCSARCNLWYRLPILHSLLIHSLTSCFSRPRFTCCRRMIPCFFLLFILSQPLPVYLWDKKNFTFLFFSHLILSSYFHTQYLCPVYSTSLQSMRTVPRCLEEREFVFMCDCMCVTKSDKMRSKPWRFWSAVGRNAVCLFYT